LLTSHTCNTRRHFTRALSRQQEFLTAAPALQDRQRFVDEVAMVLRYLSSRRHLIDDLRQHLRHAVRRLGGRNSELLRDLPELAPPTSSCLAGHYAAEDRVENSHGPSRMCEGRSLRCNGGNARQPPPSAVRIGRPLPQMLTQRN